MKYLSSLLAGAATIMSLAAAPVTFKVNMGVKTAEGLFDPLTDLVEVRGAFNGWGGGSELADPDGDRIYEGVVEVDATTAQEYKFVTIKGSDFSVVWESINNRSFVPTGAEQVLETAFFNNDSVVSIPVKGEIRFAVDMSVQIASGNFNKTSDEVYVRGNRMGWGAPPEGLKLFEDAAKPGTYTNVYTMDSVLTGEPIEYKFTIWRPETSATVWEEGANKSVAFAGNEPDTDADTYLELAAGPLYFNNLGPENALAEDTAVTFSVDMSNATRLDGTPFLPGFEGVWVNGNFANWWAWGASPAEYQMVDDGASGDAVAGDSIYSLTVTIPRGTTKMLDYKYAIDSLDNEAGFADNHIRYVRASGTFKLPTDVFGQMVKETPDGGPSDLGAIAIRRAANGNVTLDWTGGAGIRLQKTASLGAASWSDVAGSSGASTITVPASGSAGFFRLIR